MLENEMRRFSVIKERNKMKEELCRWPKTYFQFGERTFAQKKVKSVLVVRRG